MYAIIKGETRTADFDTFDALIASDLVAPYFVWGNEESGYTVDEYEVEQARDSYLSGFTTHDITVGEGECVLFFPENAPDAETMQAEEKEWLEIYKAAQGK